jgi:hypothetical protein
MEGVGRARPARPEAPKAVLGVCPGGGDPPGRDSGVSPRENFNLTTLMCILETENFTFVLHVHSYI